MSTQENSGYDMDINVWTDLVETGETSDPYEGRPRVDQLPELQVIPSIPEIPDALAESRQRALIISTIPGAPTPKESDFGRKDDDSLEN